MCIECAGCDYFTDNNLFDGVDPREQEKINIANLLLKDALNKFYQEDLFSHCALSDIMAPLTACLSPSV